MVDEEQPPETTEILRYNCLLYNMRVFILDIKPFRNIYVHSFHFSWDCGGNNQPENPVPYSNGFIVGGSVSQTCTYDASSNEHVTVKVNASNLVSWEVYETELLGDYFCY